MTSTQRPGKRGKVVQKMVMWGDFQDITRVTRVERVVKKLKCRNLCMIPNQKIIGMGPFTNYITHMGGWVVSKNVTIGGWVVKK